MREAHKADYTAATQYITSRMAQINSASLKLPGTNLQRISEVATGNFARNEFNGVDIRDPWQKFTDDKWFNKLGTQGQEIIQAKRRTASGRPNNTGRGRTGRGRESCGQGGGRGGFAGGHNGQSQNTNNDKRDVNEASTGDPNSAPAQAGGNKLSTSMSTISLTHASTTSGNDRGGQNGNRFGSNRP